MLKRKAYKTDYPEIYKNTYWGCSTGEIEPETIENRNKFITDYNIKHYKSRPPQFIEKIINRNVYRYLDHTEVYVNHDKEYILISSPYGGRDKEDEHLKDGWTEIYHLYNPDAKTFIMKCNMKYKK
jgi:hypothetical protein